MHLVVCVFFISIILFVFDTASFNMCLLHLTYSVDVFGLLIHIFLIFFFDSHRSQSKSCSIQVRIY